MKKILSVLLASLFVLMSLVPAFAEDGKYTVTFYGPELGGQYLNDDGTPGYWYYPTVNGDYVYILDTDETHDLEWRKQNDYVYDEVNNRYIFAPDVIENGTTSVLPSDPAQYYTYQRFEWTGYQDGRYVSQQEYDAGTVVSFKVMTSNKFNAATVIVRTGSGQQMEKSVVHEYKFSVEGNASFSVYEREGDTVILTLNRFFVYLPKGDDGEYRCRAVTTGKTTPIVQYGDSFEFLVVVDDKLGVVNNLSVKSISGTYEDEFDLGVDPRGILAKVGILGYDEPGPQFLGLDENGNRRYRIDHITDDCTVFVDGVAVRSDNELISLIKRILRLFLNLLGIKIGFLEPAESFNITINNGNPGVRFAVLEGGSEEELNGNVLKVYKNDCVTLVVKSTVGEVGVTASPIPINGGAWTFKYDDKYNLYSSNIYRIDNITQDVVINIG